MNNAVVPERSLPVHIPVPAIATPPAEHAAIEAFEAAQEDGSVQLKDLLGMLRRHKLLVAVMVVLCTGASGYLAWRQVPLYRAAASLRLRDQRAAMTEGIGDDALQQVMMGKTNDPILSEIQVLGSRTVAAMVVDREQLRLAPFTGRLTRSDLAQVSVAPDAGPDTIALRFTAGGYEARGRAGHASAAYGQAVRIGGATFAVRRRPERAAATLVVRSRPDAVDVLLRSLHATAREKTDVVDLSYTDPDPRVAAAIVNTTADVFQSLNIRNAQDQSRRRADFVAEQLHQADSAQAQAQQALTAFRQHQQLYSSREKLEAQQTALIGLEARRGDLQAERSVYQTLLDGLQRGRGGEQGLHALVSSPEIAANPVVTNLYLQLAHYEAARDSLTAGDYGSARTDPDVQRLATLITQTQSALVDAVHSHVTALDARIHAVDGLKAQGTGELVTMPGVEAEETRLVQQVATVDQMADQLRGEYQKARIEEAVEAGQVEIVDVAEPPSLPVPQHRGMKVALGLLMGILFGTGGAVVLEHLNTSLRGKDELEQVLRVPGLAIIPRIDARAGQKRRLLLPRSDRGREVDGASELVTMTDARSPAAEAYRALRTNLIFSQAVHSLRTVVVTSAAPAEGKTVTAANLAVAFAQQGMRVLLLDCDLRRPRVHEVFGAQREPGLTELVLGHRTWEQVVRTTAVDGLYILPSGTLPPNPTELLGGELMKGAVEALKREFDLLVLDTAPVTAAADAAVVGARTDAVLMVVRAGHSDRGVVQHAVQQLRNVGARVVGAVLNDPDAKVPSYGGGYYYYYSEYSARPS